MSDGWISDETEAKEADFRGLLKMHATVCKGVMPRWNAGSYLYVDLYAGPGDLTYKGRSFDGSPLIARDILNRSGLSYEAVHFERDPDVAERLRSALGQPMDLFEVPAPVVLAEDFTTGFPRWLTQLGRQRNRFGLIYADPINDEIPHSFLNMAAHHLPRVDLLSYVSATQYKRRRRGDETRNGTSDKPLLSDHVREVGKRYALIRKPRDAWQFTFILWTDWNGFPVWTQHGFHRIDEPRGAEILDMLDLTRDEHFAKTHPPLPGVVV